MTKSELKTGMIVTDTLGEELMVLKGVQTNNYCGDCLVQIDGSEEWDELDNYTEDLTSISPYAQELNIVRVSVASHPANIFASPNKSMKVLWERE